MKLTIFILLLLFRHGFTEEPKYIQIFKEADAVKTVKIKKPADYEYIIIENECSSELVSDDEYEVPFEPTGLQQEVKYLVSKADGNEVEEKTALIYTECPIDSVKATYFTSMKDDKCEAFSDIPHPENSQLQFYLEVTYKSQLKQCTKPWTLFKGYDIDSKGEDEDCKVEFKCGILDKLKDKKENSKCFFTGPEKNLILPEAGKVTLEKDWFGFKFPEAGIFNLTAKLKEAEIRFPSVTIGEQTTTSELTTTESTTVPTTPSTSVAETSPATEAAPTTAKDENVSPDNVEAILCTEASLSTTVSTTEKTTTESTTNLSTSTEATTEPSSTAQRSTEASFSTTTEAATTAPETSSTTTETSATPTTTPHPTTASTTTPTETPTNPTATSSTTTEIPTKPITTPTSPTTTTNPTTTIESPTTTKTGLEDKDIVYCSEPTTTPAPTTTTPAPTTTLAPTTSPAPTTTAAPTTTLAPTTSTTMTQTPSTVTPSTTPTTIAPITTTVNPNEALTATLCTTEETTTTELTTSVTTPATTLSISTTETEATTVKTSTEATTTKESATTVAKTESTTTECLTCSTTPKPASSTTSATTVAPSSVATERSSMEKSSSTTMPTEATILDPTSTAYPTNAATSSEAPPTSTEIRTEAITLADSSSTPARPSKEDPSTTVMLEVSLTSTTAKKPAETHLASKVTSTTTLKPTEGTSTARSSTTTTAALLDRRSTTISEEDGENPDAKGQPTTTLANPNEETKTSTLKSDGSGTGEEENVTDKIENPDWNLGGFKTKPTEDLEDNENYDKKKTTVEGSDSSGSVTEASETEKSTHYSDSKSTKSSKEGNEDPSEVKPTDQPADLGHKADKEKSSPKPDSDENGSKTSQKPVGGDRENPGAEATRKPDDSFGGNGGFLTKPTSDPEDLDHKRTGTGEDNSFRSKVTQPGDDSGVSDSDGSETTKSNSEFEERPDGSVTDEYGNPIVTPKPDESGGGKDGSKEGEDQVADANGNPIGGGGATKKLKKEREEDDEDDPTPVPSIDGKECTIESVEVVGLSANKGEPTLLKNASEISFTSDVKSNCPNDIHFYWSIYDDFNAEIPSALLSKEDKPSVVINGSRIQAKFHRVCLLVKISDSEKSSCGYFTVAENFFAVSFGNLGKSVKMVENDSVFLDPAANTVTSPPLKNITYEWLCRKTGTGEFKPISESGCFKDGYQHLPWNRGRVELKNPSTLFKKVPGNYEMKVIARGRRSTEEAIETASEIEISILNQQSEASIDFRCIPDCLFIPNRDSRKLSIGYQNVINVKCKNCHERQLFDAIRYRLVLANGTKTEWKTTKKTKIPVLKQLVPDGTKRSSVKSFEIQVTVLVDKDGTTIPDVFTQIYENNQGPSDGECSIDKLAAKNIENVTVACSGWVDEDSVSVYNVYSRLGENDPLVLVSSSSDPKQVFRLRSGEQQLFVEVLDGLRAESSLVPLGTAVVTLEKVNIGDLMISNPMEVKQILDQLKNTTNMNELLNEKTNSSKNAGWVNELIDAIGTKGGQKNVIDAVRKGLHRQLSVDTAKMSEEELQHLVDTSLRDRNAALAELMGKMLEVTAEKGINTPEDMKTVLSTVDDVLKNSMKFTLNKKQPGQSSANGYKVFYGRLRIKGTDLIVLNAQFTIDGTTVFIQGDFQPAKVMMTSRDKFDLALNYRKLAADVSLAKGFGFTVDGTTADVSDMINGTRRIDFTGNNSMGLPDGRYVAWNVSYDSKKDMETHEIENATFTTYTLLQPDSAITLEQLTEEQKKGFMFGDALNVIKISLKVYLDHKKQTLEYTGGKMELMDSFSGSMNLFIHDLEWTNKGSYDENYRTLIQDTVKIEFLDKAVIERAVASNGPTELKLTGENLRLQTGYYDVSHLAITPLEAHIQSSRLEIDKKYATMEAFNIDFKNGKAVNVDFGSISMDHGPLFDVLRGQVMLDGDSLKLAVDSEASLVTFSKIQWTVHAEGSKLVLVITKGAFSTNLQPHIASVFDVGPEQRIFLEGGKIGRNCSNCYVIKDARVSSLTGGLEGDNGLQEQSVIDQRGLQNINKALDNTNDFLKNNADKLSDKELGETADSILGIVGSVTKSINTGLKNPLSNDLQASFDYEQKNYDDLFLNVPDDPRDIRYVEEYTPEQWAEEAVRLRQKAAAKAMVNTINTLFDTIEDALVKRALDTGDTSPITRSVDGNSLTASIGLPHDLLSKDYMCNDWIVRFPPRLDLLNVYDIGERELIRTSMRCLVENLYLSSDNAKYLVTSGTLDLKLKRQNGEEIVVKDTLEPISLKTDPKGCARNAIEILPFKFEKYQVLDLHTFRTIQWNMTVTIEFEPTQKLQKDVWLFASFQRIPGPMPSDHDWRFHVTEKRFRSYFHILAAELWNRTGLFYVGIGVIAEGERALNPNLSISYPAHEFKHWVFENTPSFDYKIRAISKGCYYLNTVHRDARFDSTGMEPLSTTGTGRTSCLSNHLTTFSVGMFTPEIAQNFEYKYLETRYERNIMVLIAVAILAIHQLLAFFLAIRHDNRDFSKGGIQTLKDNRPFDHYQYVITVQTGYRMFSTTDSRVFFNVTGTQSEEIGRQMVGEMSKIKSFQWGATDRFLMTTRWSLGDLHTLRIWIDSSGFEHRQSWFCCRVVFKDLQMKKIYEFDVDNWLGIQNGNGETERLINATLKRDRKPWNLAMGLQSLGDHLSWLNMYTGGGLRTRYRNPRVDRVVNVTLALLLICLANCLHSAVGDSRKYNFRFLTFRFSFADGIFGCLYALAGIPTSILYPLVLNQTLTRHEVKLFKKPVLPRPDEEPPVKRKRKRHGLPSFVRMLWRAFWVVVMAVVLFAIWHLQFPFNEQEEHCFAKRFFFSIICWIVVVEPFKAFLCSVFCVFFYKNYQIMNRFEYSILDVLPLNAFEEAPIGHLDPTLGKTVADMVKLKESREQRMRDEQLFNTLREILWFIVSLIILLAISYFSRDSYSYHYQSKMRNLLNIDIPKDPPKNVTSFMKVTKASQFWIWAKKDLIDALFARWNDSGNAMGMRSFMNDKASRRMGFGTIRQIRSKYDTNCKVVPGFETVFDKCKGYSQYHYEDTDSFDVGWWNVVNHSDANPEYIYRTPEELQGSWFEGNQDTYSGGGYVTYLNGSRSQLRAKFERLDAENWIDDQTRAIFVEFSAYNAQVNMFAVVQLVVEVPPFGAFYPWAWVEAVRLDKYVDSNKDVIIFFEAVYCIYAGILLIKEFVTILVVGPKTYLFSIWRMVDFTTMVLAVASVVTYALRLVSITTINAKFQKTNGNFYVKLDQQRDLELLFLVFIGGVVFFVTIKMIKILSFNRRIGLLANTLSRAAGSMLGFGLCFFIVTSAFNTALYMILFAKLENYRNMFVLMMTTFVSILGKFNVGDVIRTSGLGAIIFILFMLVGTVFLLNVFVMIVMYEFEMVRTDSKLQSNDYEVVEHMKSKAMIAAGVFERHNMTNLGLPDVNSTCEPGNRLYAKLNLLLLNAEYLKSSQGPDIVRPNISERLGSLIQ